MDIKIWIAIALIIGLIIGSIGMIPSLFKFESMAYPARINFLAAQSSTCYDEFRASPHTGELTTMVNWNYCTTTNVIDSPGTMICECYIDVQEQIYDCDFDAIGMWDCN